MSFIHVIRPPKGLARIDVAEIWRSRDLLAILVWRNVKVRYKQTALGIAWAILQPLLTMLVFSFLFGRVSAVATKDVPYPLYLYVGLLFWTYFSTALGSLSNSLVESEQLVKKVYFPRVILPLSSAVTPIIDFFAGSLVLFGLMAFYGFLPPVMGLALLPVSLLFAVLSVLGLGLFFAALNVKYRDVRYALPFLIQLLFFVTPIIFPIGFIPDQFQWLFFLNPLAGSIELGRSALLGTSLNGALVSISVLSGALILVAGVAYFRRTEDVLSDLL